VCQHYHVAGFDAERYLRQAAERWVSEGGSSHGPPWNPVLSATAAALVAVDAMTKAAARSVSGDYDPAWGSGTGGASLSAPPDIGQVRVVPYEQAIDQPWGRLTIHYVTFTDRATALRATLQPSQSPAHPFGLPAGAKELMVTDDHGMTATAEFSGHARHGDPAWRGRYEVHPRLAPDTAWIELSGQRVEPTSQPAAIQVWAEPLPAQDPAVRHLWERVATLNDFHDLHLALDTTIATLVAAGALHANDLVIGDARAALAVLRPDGTRPALRPGELPGPWRSLLARWGQTDGPVGMVIVSAITPPVDGVTAAIIALESRDVHFVITVELVPGARTGLPYRDLPDQQHVTWWAADDLGNHYLAEQGSWSWSDDRAGGEIIFWPALDPQASSIDLMPTATATRAIIRIPLPWAKHS
jgi:hypothetical protein